MEIAKSSLIEMVSAMNVLSNADLEADDVGVKLGHLAGSHFE